MLIIFSFLKTLIGQEVTIELKNDLKIRGILSSVDQYHNFKLNEIEIENVAEFPQFTAVRSLFVRGSMVRYIHLPSGAVDATLLEDAVRRELNEPSQVEASSA